MLCRSFTSVSSSKPLTYSFEFKFSVLSQSLRFWFLLALVVLIGISRIYVKVSAFSYELKMPL